MVFFHDICIKKIEKNNYLKCMYRYITIKSYDDYTS